MAFDPKQKFANRQGLDLYFYRYGSDIDNAKPVAVIDYANSVSLELSSDIVWATGGRGHKRMVGFKNPYEGTLTIETQISDGALLSLLSGGKGQMEGDTVKFRDVDEENNYFIIKGYTVYKSEEGVIGYEEVIAHKAMVQPGFSTSYTGDGDPQSLSIPFQLAADDNDDVVSIRRCDEDMSPFAPSEVAKTPDPDIQILGMKVSDLIGKDIKILKDGSVEGTLHHVKYEGFSSNPEEKEGNYFPIKLSGTGSSMTLTKTGKDPKTVDFDPEIVALIPNNETTLKIEVDGKEVITLNFEDAILEKSE